MVNRTQITPQQVREIAAKGLLAYNSVLRAYRKPGYRNQPSTLLRIQRAALELGYPLPPEQSEARR